VFDTGKNLAARSRVTRILHLDRNGHISYIVQSDHQLFLEQTAKDLADEAQSSHGWTVLHKSLSKGERGNATSRDKNIFLWNRFARFT
jgi:hypothetical protein